jgi:membrane-bound lytic murein transglycosylase D
VPNSAPSSASRSFAPVPPSLPPPACRCLPDPSQEVRDELPPIPTIDLTTPPDDLWQRMRNGFSMPDLDSPLVADRQAWYLNRPDLLKRIFERSRRYLHHIVEELEKRGMPTELALLPVVESSFNPLAYSSARALGMWQFIPATGKTYKLQQNAWFDQRRDIVASTDAALDYLQTIYEMHGDWHLALASYNWGENAVGARRGEEPCEGTADRLPQPEDAGGDRLLRAQAAGDQEHRGPAAAVRHQPRPDPQQVPTSATVERSENMDVALAARLAEIPVEEFIALNPAYSRPVMPSAANSPLVLPADKVQTFLANLQHHEAQDKPLSAMADAQPEEGREARRGGQAPRPQPRRASSSSTASTPRPGWCPAFALLVPGKDAISHDSLAARLPQTPATSAQGGEGEVEGKPGKVGVKGSAAQAEKRRDHGEGPQAGADAEEALRRIRLRFSPMISRMCADRPEKHYGTR